MSAHLCVSCGGRSSVPCVWSCEKCGAWTFNARGAAILDEERAALRAELLSAREALRPFVEAAEECERHVEAQNAHVREVQRAAALSRSGDVEGGRALIKRIDSQPRVWDFGAIVLMLRKALPKARRALSPSPKGTPP